MSIIHQDLSTPQTPLIHTIPKIHIYAVFHSQFSVFINCQNIIWTSSLCCPIIGCSEKLKLKQVRISRLSPLRLLRIVFSGDMIFIHIPQRYLDIDCWEPRKISSVEGNNKFHIFLSPADHSHYLCMSPVRFHTGLLFCLSCDSHSLSTKYYIELYTVYELNKRKNSHM